MFNLFGSQSVTLSRFLARALVTEISNNSIVSSVPLAPVTSRERFYAGSLTARCPSLACTHTAGLIQPTRNEGFHLLVLGCYAVVSYLDWRFEKHDKIHYPEMKCFLNHLKKFTYLHLLKNYLPSRGFTLELLLHIAHNENK